MITKICDKCGKEIKKEQANLIQLLGDNFRKLNGTFDLCSECAIVIEEVVIKWLKGDLK